MKYKLKIKDLLVYCAVILINLYYSFNNTQVEIDTNGIILLAAVGIIFLQLILFGKFRLLDAIGILCIVLVLMVNYWYMNDSRLLVVFFLALALKNIDLNEMLKVIFYQRVINCCLIVILSLSGFLSIGKVYSSDGRVRYALGYSHPNQLMVSIVILIMLYLCVNWGNMNTIKYMILFLVLFLTYTFSISRTGLMCGLCVLILAFLQQYVGIEKFLSSIGKYVCIILMFLSIYLPMILYTGYVPVLNKIPGFTQINYNFLQILDNLLSNRLVLSHVHLMNTDVHLFYSISHVAEIGSMRYSLLDSGYLHLLFKFGSLGCVIFMLTNYIMAKHLINKKQYIYIIALIGMALYGFTEDTICSLQYNFTLMFITEIFYKKQEKGLIYKDERES